MQLDLALGNSRQLQQHRSREIQDAHRRSPLRSYRMPRQQSSGREDSTEDLPALYDLHDQNKHRKTALLPLQHLIRLNAPSTAHSRTQSHPTQLRRTRIECTLSKAHSRVLQKMVEKGGKGALGCCWRELPTLDQMETREMSPGRE